MPNQIVPVQCFSLHFFQARTLRIAGKSHGEVTNALAVSTEKEYCIRMLTRANTDLLGLFDRCVPPLGLNIPCRFGNLHGFHTDKVGNVHGFHTDKCMLVVAIVCSFRGSTQVMSDGSRVGNESIDLIYMYSPRANLGYHPPFQVPPRLAARTASVIHPIHI